MVNDLKLSGNDLMVYAIIFGFSQDGESEFNGSISYLQSFIGASSKNTVKTSLNYLTEMGLIIKTDSFFNNLKFCKYKADLNAITDRSGFGKEGRSKNDIPGQIMTKEGGSKNDPVGQILTGGGGSNFDPVGQKMPRGGSNFDPGGGSNFDPNNKVFIINSIINSTETEKIEKTEEAKEVGSVKVRQVANEAWKDDIWKEQLCIALSINTKELLRWLAMFNSSIANDRVANFTTSAYKKMSRGWIVKQISIGTTIESEKMSKKSDSAPLTVLR